MNEKIIKEIDVAIMKNRVMRRCSTSDFDKDCFRENNDLLGRVRTILKSQKEYERGMNDDLYRGRFGKKLNSYDDIFNIVIEHIKSLMVNKESED